MGKNKNCLEIAIKNLSKHKTYRIIALCGDNENCIEVRDSKNVIHKYKFHFILTNGKKVIDTMHYSKPVDVFKYFEGCISKNAVFDTRVSEIDCELLLKLISKLGYNKVNYMYSKNIHQ